LTCRRPHSDTFGRLQCDREIDWAIFNLGSGLCSAYNDVLWRIAAAKTWVVMHTFVSPRGSLRRIWIRSCPWHICANCDYLFPKRANHYTRKMSESAVPSRTRIVRQGRRLEYFTIAWNAFEGLVAVVAGAIAGSISLVGFGIDSFIEVTSGSVLLWRMSVDADVQRREGNERRALKLVGSLGEIDKRTVRHFQGSQPSEHLSP